MGVMAKIYNLKIYAKADAGQRVFSVPASRALAVRVGLRARGWNVKGKTTGKITTLTIQ